MRKSCRVAALAGRHTPIDERFADEPVLSTEIREAHSLESDIN